MEAVVCKNIKKQYKKNDPLQFMLNIEELKLEEGKIYGLLGPNGAGKSTLVKIILDLIFADEGEVEIMGKSNKLPESRENIGYLPENSLLPTYLTFHQFLLSFGLMYKLDGAEIKGMIDFYCSKLGLKSLYKRKIKTLSKGMTQSMLLIHALLSNKKILFLDEPFNGLDPKQKKITVDFLKEFNKEIKNTYFISTHILSDIEKLADEIIIINNGQIKAKDSINNILENYPSLESYYFQWVEDEKEIIYA